MKKLSYLFILSFLINLSLTAQETYYLEEWYQSTGLTNDNDLTTHSVSLYNSQNQLYVATSTLNGSGISTPGNTNYFYDITLTKYNKKGKLLWTQDFNIGSKNAFVGDMILDNNQRPVIVGSVYNDNTESYDAFTVRYSPAGVELWHRLFDGTANKDDGAKKVFVDSNNQIYVIGGAVNSNTQSDFVTIKYNSNGIEQWNNTYDNAGLDDIAGIGSVDGNIVNVLGIVETSSGIYEQAQLEYNANSGALLSTTITSGILLELQKVNDAILDDEGNLYITGAVITNQGFDFKTIKLNPELDIVWTVTYNSINSGDDVAKAITLDSNNDVYVTGYSTLGSGRKTTTIKYSNSGTQIWENTSTAQGIHEGNDVKVATTSEVFVTGYYQEAVDGNKDFSLYQYDIDGLETWKTNFNGIHNKDDEAVNINLDGEGNVSISGGSKNENEHDTYLTVKYHKHELIIPPNDSPIAPFNYIENKGQLTDINGVVTPNIKFYNQDYNTNLYFANDLLSMVVANIPTDLSTQDTLHRVDMIFNDNADVRNSMRVAPLNEKITYFNYFLAHIPEGRARVRAFDNIVYSDIYDNIDLVFSSNSKGSKFYLICKPNSNPSEIALVFNGQNNLSTGINNELLIGTSWNNITFPQAKAFQIDGNGSEVNLNWQPNYSITNEEVSFNSIGNYNPNLTLVFEISEDAIINTSAGEEHWITPFYQSSSIPYIDVLSTGVENEIFGIFGQTGKINIPTTPNITITTFGINSSSAFVGSFDEIGQLKWATVLGGTEEEKVLDGIISNSNGEIEFYIVGKTNSTDLPTTSSSYNGGVSDGLIFGLNEQGDNLLFSKYIGTHKEDVITGITKHDNRMFVCGVTDGDSPNLIPTINGTYNKLNNINESDDGFVLELDVINQSILWGTLFGGEGDDSFGDIEINPHTGNIFCIGNTNTTTSENISSPSNNANNFSNNFQLCTPNNAYEQLYANGGAIGSFNNDLIIVEFSSNLELLWSTYYGGVGGEFNQRGSDVIKFSNDPTIWAITGYTTNLFSLPHPTVSSNEFQQIFDGSSAFIVKFNNRTPIWSTGFGCSGHPDNFSGGNLVNVTQPGIAFDNNNNLYLRGETYCDIPVSPAEYCIVPLSSIELPICETLNSFYQVDDLGVPIYGGDPFPFLNFQTPPSDVFYAGFSEANEFIWSTYLGGNREEKVSAGSIKIINNGTRKLYSTGTTHPRINFTVFPPPSGSKEFPSQFPINGVVDLTYFQEQASTLPNGFIARLAIADFISTNSIDILKSSSEFTIYPNPSNGIFTVEIISNISNNSKISIVDVAGKKVFEKNYQGNKFNIDISHLAKGVYFVNYNQESIVKGYTSKIIIH